MDNLKKVVDIKEERVEKLEKNQFSLGADRRITKLTVLPQIFPL